MRGSRNFWAVVALVGAVVATPRLSAIVVDEFQCTISAGKDYKPEAREIHYQLDIAGLRKPLLNLYTVGVGKINIVQSFPETKTVVSFDLALHYRHSGSGAQAKMSPACIDGSITIVYPGINDGEPLSAEISSRCDSPMEGWKVVGANTHGVPNFDSSLLSPIDSAMTLRNGTIFVTSVNCRYLGTQE